MSRPPLITDLPSEAREVHAQATPRESRHAGGRLVWHVWGQGEPVVLLHGGSGSWTHWIRNVQALADAGRSAWVPDMPGFGDSDKPAGGEDADSLVDPLLEGIEQLLDGRAYDLVGFSFGGLTAGLMAARHPPGLRRLVLAGAPVAPVVQRALRLLEWRHLTDPAEREKVHRHNLLTLMVARQDRATPLDMQLHAANLDRDRMRRRHLVHSTALPDALERVTCPVDAIYGHDDAIFKHRIDELVAALDAIPTLRSRHLVKDSGHWVQFETPESFNTLLLQVLSQAA